MWPDPAGVLTDCDAGHPGDVPDHILLLTSWNRQVMVIHIIGNLELRPSLGPEKFKVRKIFWVQKVLTEISLGLNYFLDPEKI